MNKKYRKAIIAGNWKMNMAAGEVKNFIEELKQELPKTKTCDVVICSPATMLSVLGRAVKDTGRISAGAQDISQHEKGAYTGEISGAMIAELGSKYVIIGHSERRQYHGETDFSVNTKSKAAIANGLTPIICVGESLEQRELALTLEYIAYQTKAALAGLSEDQVRKCVIAYEPIWAIGTGKVATSEQAQEVCAEIRRVVKYTYGAKAARCISILYGGSMNAGNAEELLSMDDIDGGLIGGASLKPADFAKIAAATAQD